MCRKNNFVEAVVVEGGLLDIRAQELDVALAVDPLRVSD